MYSLVSLETACKRKIHIVYNFILRYFRSVVYLTRLTEAGKSRDSLVGIALGYRLDDRGSRFRFPAGAGNFSLHHRVQNGSGAQPASYPMVTGGSFPRDKAAAA
jgi:hypothetical protein